ncbi:caspase family protein [Vibrio parahaemolyticus]|nr:caspase family protein [Vibrio parahaemolyticus]
MPIGYALCIGVSAVDLKNYNVFLPKIDVCDKDAKSIYEILKKNGFKSSILLNKSATREKIKDSFQEISKKVVEGDIFVIYFSGHGVQRTDSEKDESDLKDESICLYDGPLWDDEIKIMLSNLNHKSRLLFISDSCHSGTIVDREPSRYIKCKRPENLIQISSCLDHQISKPGYNNSLFTGKMIDIYNERIFSTYETFFKEIKRRCPKIQQPSLYFTQNAKDGFLYEEPFKI